MHIGARLDARGGGGARRRLRPGARPGAAVVPPPQAPRPRLNTLFVVF